MIVDGSDSQALRLAGGSLTAQVSESRFLSRADWTSECCLWRSTNSQLIRSRRSTTHPSLQHTINNTPFIKTNFKSFSRLKHYLSSKYFISNQ